MASPGTGGFRGKLMLAMRGRLRPALGPGLLLILLLAVLVGCAGKHCPIGRVGRFGGEQRPIEELRAATGWYDLDAQAAIRNTIPNEDLLAWANRLRAESKPAVPNVPKNILILSGGGVFGAYCAGVLSGWTEAGTRPEFDVVTGISTGALVACFAFLGPEFDSELRRYYTTVRDEDIFIRRRLIPSLLSESLADSKPLSCLIENAITDDRIARVAEEHRKGRRLYIGTSDLDVRRAVVWDLGAIASQNTPESRRLIRDILLASASIPGFFPPVRIPVTVDGQQFVERHVDGSTSSSMFFVPPYVPPEARATLPSTWLHGSNLYILVAGKLYADPVPVKARSLYIASNAVSTILYDQTRSDLQKLFLLSVLTGMNYNLASIPKDLQATTESTKFDPVEMTRLFEAGAEWSRTNRNWRLTPPGYEPGEGSRYRTGTILTDVGRRGPVGAPPGGPMIPPVIPDKN